MRGVSCLNADLSVAFRNWQVCSVAFSSDDQLVLCGDYGAKLTLMEAECGEIVWRNTMAGGVRHLPLHVPTAQPPSPQNGGLQRCFVHRC